MHNQSIILENSDVYILNKSVIKRFEHNIKDGVLFLYNVDTNTTWIGNSSSLDLIRLIEKKYSIGEIYNTMQSLFIEYDYEIIKSYINNIFTQLLSKNFIEKS